MLTEDEQNQALGRANRKYPKSSKPYETRFLNRLFQVWGLACRQGGGRGGTFWHPVDTTVERL